jgi:hypothetical protein
VSFFDEFPPPLPDHEFATRAPQPWDGAPVGWVGGWVPWRIVLVRSDSAYVALSDFEAFPTGLQFSFVSHVREEPEERGGRLGHRLLFLAQGGLRLGVAFADGRKAVAEHHMGREPSGDPNQPVLRLGGGIGSASEHHMRFWLWPLPPPGPLTWVTQWPDRNLPVNSTEVDATILQVAAGEAEQLWEIDNEANRGWGSSSSSFQSGILHSLKIEPSEPPS